MSLATSSITNPGSADQNAARYAQIVNASTVTGGAVNPPEAGSTAASTEDRFLKLLVAQMRNQDPLNPLDNAQVTTQLAQINTVRGIENLNTSVGKLVERGANSPLEAVGLLGRQVLAPGDSFELGAGATQRLGFELPSGARRALAEVLDASGNVVFSRSFDAPPAGISSFSWNGASASGGTVPPGSYRLRVTASDGTRPIEAAVLSSARVIGVMQGGDGVQLELAGRSPVAPAAIRGVI